MPSVFVTTTKSTPVALRAASARGWSTAVGSGERSAARMPGELANVAATATDRLRASTVLSCRTWSTSATAAATTSSSTMTTFMTKTWAATLRPDSARRSAE